jgi:hypothetical protein
LSHDFLRFSLGGSIVDNASTHSLATATANPA